MPWDSLSFRVLVSGTSLERLFVVVVVQVLQPLFGVCYIACVEYSS